ncbi:MAG: HEAT repeat domain-containing protein [Tannerella sp.]|jgi:hypothetical protein|nr:HEAT repeat domain-containing protein [Tannerella sp.]
MDIKLLREEFKKLLKMEDTDDGIFDFKDLLLESDDKNVLEFHYSLLSTIEDEYLYKDILYFFSDRKDKNEVEDFLFYKYNQEKNETIKSDILKVLGTMKVSKARDIALNEIESTNYNLRYSSIIVLGWTGTNKDLSKLNRQMLNDPDGQLRGYAATAMRQIWYKYPQTRDEIANFIYSVASSEKNEDALTGMIITIQDLYRKKFGIKESQYGDISGNVLEAKAKMMTFLNKTLH